VITRKMRNRIPVELPNGANVVCRHCFLALFWNGQDGWRHIYSLLVQCRPAHGGRPAGPYVAEPYILP
jgi:hypothetical protein